MDSECMEHNDCSCIANLKFRSTDDKMKKTFTLGEAWFLLQKMRENNNKN